MNSFVIGRVVEPEVAKVPIKGEVRSICKFGLLTGRTCVQFDIFDDAKVFGKASKLKDGALILAVVGVSVDKNNALRYYLNDFGDCPDGLRNQLLDLIKK